MRLTKEKFLELSSQLYEQMCSQLDSETQDFYTYESTFDTLFISFGKSLLEESVDKIPVEEQKKKIQTRYGKISVDKKHPYSDTLNGFCISPYMQERMAYVGQTDVYSECNNLLNKLLCIEINHMQVYRVTDKIGSLSADVVNETSTKSLEIKESDIVYAQADGAMVLTRESKWQEVKTGRIFKQSDIVELSTHRKELQKSLYVSNLGHYEGFIAKFEPLTDRLDSLGARLVLLSDGATWLRQWGQECYPKATHILDFYHACEHLNQGLDVLCKDKNTKKEFYEKWKEVLLKQGIEVLLAAINQEFLEDSLTKTQKESKRQLRNYLNTNAYRMKYPEYIKRGLLIGSGAIESAQRTVLQKRLKRAGQRWSQEGVQHMLNLRVAYLSGEWDKIKEIILCKKAA